MPWQHPGDKLLGADARLRRVGFQNPSFYSQQRFQKIFDYPGFVEKGAVPLPVIFLDHPQF